MCFIGQESHLLPQRKPNLKAHCLAPLWTRCAGEMALGVIVNLIAQSWNTRLYTQQNSKAVICCDYDHNPNTRLRPSFCSTDGRIQCGSFLAAFLADSAKTFQWHIANQSDSLPHPSYHLCRNNTDSWTLQQNKESRSSVSTKRNLRNCWLRHIFFPHGKYWMWTY